MHRECRNIRATNRAQRHAPAAASNLPLGMLRARSPGVAATGANEQGSSHRHPRCRRRLRRRRTRHSCCSSVIALPQRKRAAEKARTKGETFTQGPSPNIGDHGVRLLSTVPVTIYAKGQSANNHPQRHSTHDPSHSGTDRLHRDTQSPRLHPLTTVPPHLQNLIYFTPWTVVTDNLPPRPNLKP